MDTKYRLLQFDYWIQTILGAADLACFVTVYGFFIGVWGLIPFGAVQVLSSLVFILFYRDKKRLPYIFCVAGFFILWYASTTLSYNANSEWIQGFNIVLCIFPPTLGIWYYSMTRSDYKTLKQQKGEVYFNDDEILDA